MALPEDVMFSKALKLLHSTAKDSTLQMMHLLEEVIDLKYGVGTKTLNLKLHSLVEESSSSDVVKSRGSRGGSPAVIVLSEKSSRSSTPPSEPVSIRTSPDRDDADADGDLALEIFEDDLFCTVCKGIRVTSDNRLLECNDCHSLYHQDCHSPPIDSDANDPRVVWSCGDCSKSKQDKPPKSKSLESSKKHKSDTEHSEPPSKKRDTDVDPAAKKSEKERSSHKKGEKSSSTSSSSKSESKSHASKSSSSRSEHRSSSHGSSSSKSSGSSLNFNKQPGSPNSKPSCTANIIAADKRLQNMKKKAAAKMQEKRK